MSLSLTLKRRIVLLLIVLCATIVTGLVISLLQFGVFYARHPFGSFLACWGVLLFLPLAALFTTLVSRGVNPVQRWTRWFGMITALLGLIWGPVAYWMTGNPSLRVQGGPWFLAIVIWAFAILIFSLLTVAAHVSCQILRVRARRESNI